MITRFVSYKFINKDADIKYKDQRIITCLTWPCRCNSPASIDILWVCEMKTCWKGHLGCLKFKKIPKTILQLNCMVTNLGFALSVDTICVHSLMRLLGDVL